MNIPDSVMAEDDGTLEGYFPPRVRVDYGSTGSGESGYAQLQGVENGRAVYGTPTGEQRSVPVDVLVEEGKSVQDYLQDVTGDAGNGNAEQLIDRRLEMDNPLTSSTGPTDYEQNANLAAVREPEKWLQDVEKAAEEADSYEELVNMVSSAGMERSGTENNCEIDSDAYIKAVVGMGQLARGETVSVTETEIEKIGSLQESMRRLDGFDEEKAVSLGQRIYDSYDVERKSGEIDVVREIEAEDAAIIE